MFASSIIGCGCLLPFPGQWIKENKELSRTKTKKLRCFIVLEHLAYEYKNGFESN
jgi:hypothetical protein